MGAPNKSRTKGSLRLSLPNRKKMVSERQKIHWERRKEIKEQVINFIVLMMEEHKIDTSDLE